MSIRDNADVHNGDEGALPSASTKYYRQGRVWADTPEEAYDKISEIGRVVVIRRTHVSRWYEYVVEVEKGE